MSPMQPSRICSRLLPAALLAATIAAPLHAETVLLRNGNQVGVGWLYLGADGSCRIVTPRHVIQTDAGELMEPELLERNGRVTSASDPIGAADPDVDLAFLRASPILGSDGCTDSRLLGRPLDALLASMDTGILNIITDGDQQTIRVQARAASIDDFGGSIIAVEPMTGEENLKSGMSGSVILVNGEPLAMLYFVDPDGVGRAYRFDAIANYASAAIDAEPRSDMAADGAAWDIALVEGTLSDGSLDSLRAPDGPVELAYARRRVVFRIDLAGDTPVSGVQIEAPSDHELGVTQMIVEAATASGRFAYVRSCEGLVAAPRMQCAFAPRQAAQLRISFVERTDGLGRSAFLSSLEVLRTP